VGLEQEAKGLQSTGEGGLGKVKSDLDRLLKENQELKNRYAEVEAENRDFAARHVEVEEENNNLANLYVASYQLHSTLDFEEVVRIIIEIVINLVGSDRFAIMIRDDTSDDLQLVASEGVDQKALRNLIRGDSIIGNVVKTGESYFEEELSRSDEEHHRPIVCIPLKIKDKIIGTLVVFSLFEQKKKKLNRVDYELFSMLAGHAATALFSSRLYSQSERKLSTLQGFLKLLSAKDG
jgi:transcriptional regulator with GAF, ATPase, and Fis domain